MSKQQRLHQAHIALIAWTYWHVDRQQRCCLSYPGSTVEYRLSQGGLAQSIGRHSHDPELMMKPHVAAVDRALKRMSEPTRALVQWKYVEPGIATEGQRITRWRQATGLGHAAYYRHFDLARKLVANELDRIECVA